MHAQTTPTQYITVDGTKLAFRRFGKPNALPLLFLTHLRGTMDLVDPLLANKIAETRELILYDDAGCGHSEGKVPVSLQDSGNLVVKFLQAIDSPRVDILGFSLGGMVAQTIAVNHPGVINKLILAGTQSAYTEGMVFSGPEIAEIASGVSPSDDDMLKLFFSPSEESKSLGRAWLERLQERRMDGEQQTRFVGQADGLVQTKAIGEFVSDPAFFEKLKQVEIPILVTNGKEDIMTPTPNSFILQQQLRNAELHLYPDSGHGHLYQVPVHYAAQVDLFLR
jgi:pimeloyl-ACP methyl ester carboxylesterase